MACGFALGIAALLMPISRPAAWFVRSQLPNCGPTTITCIRTIACVSRHQGIPRLYSAAPRKEPLVGIETAFRQNPPAGAPRDGRDPTLSELGQS